MRARPLAPARVTRTPEREMAGLAAWDALREPAWTRREMADHVSHVYAYAEYVGCLT